MADWIKIEKNVLQLVTSCVHFVIACEEKIMEKFVRRGLARGVSVSVGLLMLCATVLFLHQDGNAQGKIRVNPLIDRLAHDQPALMGETWTFIDMQHRVFSMDRLQTIISENFKAKPDGQFEKAPVVRVPMNGSAIEPNAWIVEQALQRGAMGIVFPGVSNKEEAAAAVRTMHGTLGRPSPAWGIKDRSKVYGEPDVWPLNPNGELLAIIMIENKEGVKNADAIMSVPGIGAINVGPTDLSRSLGVRPPAPGPNGTLTYAPETEAAIQVVLKACKAHKVVCFLGGNVDVKQRLAEGWKMLFAQGARTM